MDSSNGKKKISQQNKQHLGLTVLRNFKHYNTGYRERVTGNCREIGLK